MPTTLDQIVASTRERVENAKRDADLNTLRQLAAAHRPRGFRLALQRQAAQGAAIVAEVKKASPSKGLIRPDFNPEFIAREYTRAGATAISVLTEPQFFLGSLQNLRVVSAATSLPCLRKDFIVDEFQLLEARASGADATLLLASVLGDGELRALVACARALDLDVLCEVHNEVELERALDCSCDLIGVNSRDLHSFNVDLQTAIRLASLIPAKVLKVAESGIHTGEDMWRLREAGYSAFLIGESLMRAQHPGEALQRFLTAFAEQAAAGRKPYETPSSEGSKLQ